MKHVVADIFQTTLYVIFLQEPILQIETNVPVHTFSVKFVFFLNVRLCLIFYRFLAKFRPNHTCMARLDGQHIKVIPEKTYFVFEATRIRKVVLVFYCRSFSSCAKSFEFLSFISEPAQNRHRSETN